MNEFGWDYHFDQKDGLVIKNDKVKLENPEEWTYVDEDYGGGMGERLPIMLNGIPDHQVFSKRNDKDGWLGHPNVGFCNTTGICNVEQLSILLYNYHSAHLTNISYSIHNLYNERQIVCLDKLHH